MADQFTFTKIVREPELQKYRVAAELGIAPQILSVHPLPGDDRGPQFQLQTVRMPIVLAQVIVAQNHDLTQRILWQAKELVQILHQNNILHGDLSEENIVYDPNMNRTYIIDYGMSRWIDSIAPAEIPDQIENLYEGVRFATVAPADTIEYLLAVEIGIIDFLLKASQTSPPVYQPKLFNPFG